MDLDTIERLLALVARAPIAELELSEGGWRIRLVKAGIGPAATPPATAAAPQEAGYSPLPSPDVASIDRAATPSHVVAAGLVGTFYRRPAPDKPPFVAVGDRVEIGQTLGIMEAMKMLIPVEAEVAGRIDEILKEDGTAVEAGEPLFAIVPADRA